MHRSIRRLRPGRDRWAGRLHRQRLDLSERCRDPVTVTDATVSVALGDHLTCTITNNDQAAQLTLLKTVVNDNGGTAVDTDWTLSADGPTDWCRRCRG